MTKYGYYRKRSEDMTLTQGQRDYAKSFCIGANNPKVKHSSERRQLYYELPKNHPDYGKEKFPPAKNEVAFRAGQRYERAYERTMEKDDI